MNITIYTKPNMLGHFEFRLCPEQDSPKLTDLQSCFDRYPLTILETNYSQYFPGSKGGFYDMHVVLPKLVSCDRCVIQWKYITGYRLGWNPNSCGRCLGCGAQETYINCADVSIVNSIAALSHDHNDDNDFQHHHNVITTTPRNNKDVLILPKTPYIGMFHTHPASTETTAITTSTAVSTTSPTTTTMMTTTTATTTTAKPTTTTTTTAKPTTTTTKLTTTTTIKTTAKPITNNYNKMSATSTTFPRRRACKSFYPNMTCDARGLQKYVPGMKLWCSYQCSTGTCPYQYCECFCVYPDGATVYLHEQRRPITPMGKFGQVSDTCYGPVDAFKDNPGMPEWCHLNCPGLSCFNICEPVDCQK
ncbi:integumentary mucin C.1-like [Gigantopelta aegis]|uniref:integumentary mucin C.1-like n=1 Tax=Gigantopelta aegis TaxID=1735272 RepID=UPI001B88DEBA|nr:integumentary mucin C.1-like [Gigantopelta aegis]